MISSKVKTLAIVFALFLFTGIVTVGCKQKTENSWVNTSSLPGKTFSQYNHKNDAKRGNSAIVYLGPDKDAPNVNFGPRDVSFNFRDLK